MSSKRILPILSALFLLIVVGFVFSTFLSMGGFKAIQPLELESCRPVLGVLSSEDITIDPENGIAFVSGSDRRHLADEPFPGAIYRYPLVNPPLRPENLTADLNLEFNPHGLSLYRGPNGLKVLFVVNHRAEMDYIEVFDVQGSALVHRESISGDLLFAVNDIVAVDEHRFYVTRDHGYRSYWGRKLEEYLRLGRSAVVYYDGAGFQEVAGGISYANGINLSPDGLQLYVASTLRGKIHVYSRDPDDGRLTPQDQIMLGTGVDNIELDDFGNLWVAAHPRILSFVEYSQDPKAFSPSQVLKVTFLEDGTQQIEEVYLSRGEYLSGSSVAANWHNYLLIGSVFDRRFLVCELEPELKGNSE